MVVTQRHVYDPETGPRFSLATLRSVVKRTPKGGI